jgi:hypothetical protein
MMNFLDTECIKELILFVCIYRKCLNAYGWESIQKDETEMAQEEYCSLNTAEHAVLICNDFIIDYLPCFFKENPDCKLNILGSTEE